MGDHIRFARSRKSARLSGLRFMTGPLLGYSAQVSTRAPFLSGAAAIFFLVVAMYFPTLRGGFVYDSIAQVLYSDYIHTSSHWGDVLTLRVVGQDELDRNRPLHLASLMFDAAIWGKEPFGYRLTSVLLYALNASLLFVFVTVALRRRTNPVAAAACPPVCGSSPSVVFLPAVFGALLFALHPLVVEAVAEPSNREDLLVLLPMLIGLVTMAAPMRPLWGTNAALVLCSFVAVLAKESGIAVPFVFAVAAWLSGDFRRYLPGLVGGLAATVGFLSASYIWRPDASAILAHAPNSLAPDLLSLLAVQSRIWTLQFSQIAWPWDLCAHYPPEAISGISLPVAVEAIGALVVAATFAWRTHRLAGLGIAIYVLCLLPASNFAAQYHPIADRYLYVPLAGLGLIAASAGAGLHRRFSGRSAGIVLASMALGLLALEYAANLRRQFIWQQPATLWSDVLRQYPNMSQAQIGMANVHYRAGDFAQARAFAHEVVRQSQGRWAEAIALRAVCEWQLGNREEAAASFRQARSQSRIFQSQESMVAVLFFAPDQLEVLGQIARGVRR